MNSKPFCKSVDGYDVYKFVEIYRGPLDGLLYELTDTICGRIGQRHDDLIIDNCRYVVRFRGKGFNQVPFLMYCGIA